MEQNNNQYQQEMNQQQCEQQNEQQNEKQRRNKQVMFSIIGIAILVIGLVGVTFAFFNYTRTGTANTIKTGRIYFDAEQSGVVTLSDLFPITIGQNETVTPQTPGVGSLSIHVTGDTTYTEGIEYLVKAVNVTGTSNANLPISISIGYEAAEGQDKTIGESDENYFANRGGNTSRYKVLSTSTISEGEDLVVGYIAPGATGIDGNIVIMAYLDARNIAISDTYPERTVRTAKETFSSADITACENALTGAANASTYCASASALQTALDTANTLSTAQINALISAGLVTEYTDGTTSNWVNNRTVLTTEEWNAFQASGVSFKVRVEANEGIWVPIPGPATLSLSSNSGYVAPSGEEHVTITTDGDGAMTCASSDDTVATCTVSADRSTLNVNGVAVGTATITLTEAAGSLYGEAATATYEVTVQTND